jgi:hypothetical protein
VVERLEPPQGKLIGVPRSTDAWTQAWTTPLPHWNPTITYSGNTNANYVQASSLLK